MTMERRFTSKKLEMLIASALMFIMGIVKLSPDLPYNGPCGFFFGEPEYPSDDE